MPASGYPDPMMDIGRPKLQEELISLRSDLDHGVVELYVINGFHGTSMFMRPSNNRKQLAGRGHGFV
jgi:hypothetical protein